MNQIFYDYREYTDEYGFIQPDSGISQNGQRFTAEYIYALVRNHCLSVFHQNRLVEIYRRCETDPGLHRRSPENYGDQQSMDNLIGIGLASFFIDPTIARDVLEFGRYTLPRYTYNNVSLGRFSWSAWMGRYPQLICHLMFCAGENPSLWRKIWWCGSVILSMFKKGQDDKILSWMLVVAGKSSRLCRKVGAIWSKKFKKDHPGGVGEVIASYFQNENHPSVKYLWEVYD